MDDTAPSSPAPGGWARLWRSVRQQRKGVLLGVLAGICWTGAKVAVPSFTRVAIDEGIIRNESGALLRWTIVIVVLGLIQGFFTGIRRYLAFGIAYRGETELRHNLFTHLQRLHFAFHDQAQTGQLMSRLSTDLQQIQGFLVMIPITISNILTLLAVTAILLTYNVGLTILALGSLPLINVFSKRFASQIHPVSLEMQQELAGLATVVEETVTGIRVVKGFGAEEIQAGALKDAGDRVYGKAMHLARIRAAFQPAMEFLPILGLVAVLWYGGHQVLNGALSIGELVAFMTYVVMLIQPLRMTGMIIAQAQRAVASAERVQEILLTAPEIVDKPDAQPLPAGGGELRFENVQFAYQRGGHPVLRDVDLVVRPGEAVALVGATGSGKSTVARLVPRFYEITGGAVQLDGVDIRDIKVKELREAVGIVFEDTFLFSDTIRANIAFADPDAPDEQVMRAARLAGAHEFIEELPQGYDTEIGERGLSLSGGQRQRIALARAILADPRVLILDDATSSVDPAKEHEIREALDEVMHNRTTIVIAHRPATIALADRVVLLDEGRIVADGTHEELLATSERYRTVLARQHEHELELAAATQSGGTDVVE